MAMADSSTPACDADAKNDDGNDGGGAPPVDEPVGAVATKNNEGASPNGSDGEPPVNGGAIKEGASPFPKAASFPATVHTPRRRVSETKPPPQAQEDSAAANTADAAKAGVANGSPSPKLPTTVHTPKRSLAVVPPSKEEDEDDEDTPRKRMRRTGPAPVLVHTPTSASKGSTKKVFEDARMMEEKEEEEEEKEEKGGQAATATATAMADASLVLSAADPSAASRPPTQEVASPPRATKEPPTPKREEDTAADDADDARDGDGEHGGRVPPAGTVVVHVPAKTHAGDDGGEARPAGRDGRDGIAAREGDGGGEGNSTREHGGERGEKQETQQEDGGVATGKVSGNVIDVSESARVLYARLFI